MQPLVLIVDDDPLLLSLLAHALNDEGYDIATAAHGVEALRAIAKRMPQLVLVDIRMPVMDGPTFIKAYRERTNRPAPIVAITGMSHKDAQHLGIEAVIDKPFDMGELLSLIARLLKTAHDTRETALSA